MILPVSALAGLVVEVDSNYNLTKTLAALPEGAFVAAPFPSHEFETYGQDSWRVTPNLVLHVRPALYPATTAIRDDWNPDCPVSQSE